LKLNELKIRRVGVVTGIKEIVKLAEGAKPLMLMFIGLPGSGKSTFRTKLEAALKSVNKEMFDVASSDDMIEEIAKASGITYNQALHGSNPDVMKKKLIAQIKKSIEDGKSVVVDRTNVAASKRQTFIQLTPDHYQKVAVVFEVDEKVLASRIKKRAEETGKHIPDTVMDSMKKEYVEPTHKEGFDYIIFIS
jgi:predicted kinase